MKPTPGNTLQLSLQGCPLPGGHLFLLRTVPSPQNGQQGTSLPRLPGWSAGQATQGHLLLTPPQCLRWQQPHALMLSANFFFSSNVMSWKSF